MKYLSIMDRRLNQVVEILTDILLAGMFLITVVNVFLRYFFNINLLWAYDVLRVLFVGFVFFAASIVTFRREHASFVFVKGKLSFKTRYVLDVFTNMSTALFYALVAYYGYHLCVNVSNQKMPASGISAVFLYVLLVAAVAIMSIHSLIAIVVDTQNLKPEEKKEGGCYGK